jgi:hypothetical protein
MATWAYLEVNLTPRSATAARKRQLAVRMHRDASGHVLTLRCSMLRPLTHGSAIMLLKRSTSAADIFLKRGLSVSLPIIFPSRM